MYTKRLCLTYRGFGSLAKASAKSHLSKPDMKPSKFEELSCFANVHHVDGIWRAPRKLGFTKEEFDRAYPPGYTNMRIGLPDSGTFAAKYIDPRFDEISPLVWTTIFMSPLIIWGLIEAKHVYFPSEKTGHH